MHNYISTKSRLYQWGRSACTKVCIAWVAAFLLGSLLGSLIQSDVSARILILPICRVSLLSQILLSVLPILAVTLTAAFLGKTFVVYPLILQALAFGLTSTIACRCFASAWWLLTPLLFFSDFVSSFFVLLFLMDMFSAKDFDIRIKTLFYIAISLLFGFLNYYVISRFTQSLF